MEDLLFIALWWGTWGIALQTGRFLVFVLSLGHWRSARLAENERKRFRFSGSLVEQLDGQVVATEDGQVIAGLLFWMAACVWLFFHVSG